MRDVSPIKSLIIFAFFYINHTQNLEEISMSKRILWSVEVTKHLNKQLEDYIERDAFKTKSEFIRTAVRDRLKEERENLEVQ